MNQKSQETDKKTNKRPNNKRRNRPNRRRRPNGENSEGAQAKSRGQEGEGSRATQAQGRGQNSDRQKREDSNRDEGKQRRRSHRSGNSNSQRSGQQQASGERKNPRNQNRKNSSRRGNSQRRNRRGRSGSGGNIQKPVRVNLDHLSKEERLYLKYFDMVQRHVDERRNYYDRFGRTDKKGQFRFEKRFFNSIEKLRAWEEQLPERDKQKLERFIDSYRYDNTYSQNHDLNPEGEITVSDNEIADPHFLDSQKEALDTYKEDTEESMGSYEDYLKYKGL